MSESKKQGIPGAGAFAALRRGVAAYLLLIVVISVAGMILSVVR